MGTLFELFAAVDQAFSRVREAHPGEVRCGRGCEDCCHAVFDLSLVEAVNLKKALAALPLSAQAQVRAAAETALGLWRGIVDQAKDPAKERIRCPLLGEGGVCLCYEARPVNCRTYGIPTVIGGKGHVCGLSGFEPGKSYPTANLAALQQVLFDLSAQLAGEERGRLRWPIAAVILGQAGIEDLV
ncbi:YkgJ family cysteine cluster protein [Thiovibrio sp. JS02]